MKRYIHKIVLPALSLAATTFLPAGAYDLLLLHKEGTHSSWIVDEALEIKPLNGSVEITDGHTGQSFQIDEIKGIRYIDSIHSGIGVTLPDPVFSFREGMLCLDCCPPNSRLEVFAADGTRLISAKADGSFQIPLKGLRQPGVVTVCLNGKQILKTIAR